MNIIANRILQSLIVCSLVTTQASASVPVQNSKTSLLQPTKSIFVDRVWTGTAVGFNSAVRNGKQYVAYYNAERQMVVASRNLDSSQWTYSKFDEFIGWDSHNSITFDFDSRGIIHLSGNMHGVPLKYFRTTKPEDITTFVRVPSMTGQNEQKVTYPRFFKGSEGDLRFAYRDGVSGEGVEVINTYDAKTEKWTRLIEKPLFDGQKKVSAYYTGPIRDQKGIYHVAWCWRDTGDCQTNHDVCYAQSPDYVHFQTSSGKAIELPLTMDNAEVVDPVPIKSGLLNRVKLSVDSEDRPMVTYQKFDNDGNTQIWTARKEQSEWKIYCTTDWKDRWYFSGGGTIPMMIIYDAPRVWDNDRLYQVYINKYISPYTYIRFLDAKTLQQIGKAVRLYPPDMEGAETARRSTWQVNIQGFNIAGLKRGNKALALRWASAAANRDQPRKPVPPPSRLEVIEFTLDESAACIQSAGNDDETLSLN